MQITDEFLQAVQRDRSAYLRWLTPGALSQCMELDLPHQTLLRLAYERLPDPVLVETYLSSPAYRLALLEDLKEGLRWQGPICGPRRADDWFANPYGFAAFSVSDVREMAHLQLGLIEDTSLFSTTALMFYGFNISSRPSMAFLQGPQIAILAATFFWMIRHGHATGMTHRPWHDRLLGELRSVGISDIDSAGVRAAVHKFLELHEIGHTYLGRGARLVRDVLDRYGLSEDVLPPLGFPTPYQLASWERITAGAGSVEDVLFLYGDFLANMSLVASDVDAPTLSTLRAFNWWLVRPPRGRSRPRGICSFLVYSSACRFEEFIRDLSNVVDTALTKPDALAYRMRALEQEHWSSISR